METKIALLGDERLDVVNENITLIQKKSGLTFGTDALLLAAFARGSGGGIAADFGAGTGIVSFLTAARGKFAKLYAVEAQPDFCDLIRRNAAVNRMEDRVFCMERDLRALTPADLGGECDAILTNPPYMRAGSGKTNNHGAKAIARHEVLGGIDDFCAAAGGASNTAAFFMQSIVPNAWQSCSAPCKMPGSSRSGSWRSVPIPGARRR